jgi:hypothetical protein
VLLLAGAGLFFVMRGGGTGTPERGEDPEKPVEKAEMQFPEAGIGQVYVRVSGAGADAEWRQFAAARDTVAYERGTVFGLRLDRAHTGNLGVLESIDRHPVVALWLPALPVNEKNLALLKSLSALSELHIEAPLTRKEKDTVQETLPRCLVDAPVAAVPPRIAAVSPPPARVLHLPAQSAGRVYKRPFSESGGDWQQAGQARGDVSVAAGVEVKLELDSRVTDYTFLGAMKPEDIQGLGLVGENVTDSVLSGIKHLAGIREFKTFDAGITDAGFRQIENLTRIENLQLFNIGITDEGFQVIRRFLRLQVLIVEEVPLTTASLEALRNLPSLKRLHMLGTKITPEAFILLRNDLPGCKITPNLQ